MKDGLEPNLNLDCWDLEEGQEPEKLGSWGLEDGLVPDGLAGWDLEGWWAV